MATTGRPPWLIPAIGCGTFIVLSAVGLGLLSYFSYEMAEQNRDPERRAEKAQEILGSIPAGWHPVLVLQLPLGVSELVVLSDTPKPANVEQTQFERQGVWLNRVLARGRKGREAYLSDEQLETEAGEGAGFRIRDATLLDAGEWSDADRSISYRSYLGRVALLGWEARAVATKFAWSCPEDPNHLVLGLWFERLTADREAPTATPLGELKPLLAQLRPCRAQTPAE